MSSSSPHIAVFFPHGPAEAQNSGLARLEMFNYLSVDYDLYHFEKSIADKQYSIGSYFPQGSPKNIISLWKLLTVFKQNHKANPYQLIWVTMPPLPMALFAAVCKKLFKLPLIVDVRDPAIASVVLIKGKNGFVYKLAWWLERFVYRTANALCVTTPELGKFIAEEFSVKKPQVVVSNAANFKKSNPITLKKPYKIFFAGTFAPYQLMDQVIASAVKYKNEAEDFEFNCYGYKQKKLPELASLIERANIGNFFHLYPPINRDEVFAEIAKSHIVLVPIAGLDHPELYDYAIPLKLYEALALSKPVLLYGGTKASENLLKSDGFGVICKQDQDIFTALGELVENYAKFEDAATKATYLRETEAEKLAKLIDSLINK